MNKFYSILLSIFMLIPLIQGSKIEKTSEQKTKISKKNFSTKDREQIEELIKKTRKNSEQISFSIQQILQAIQGKKISGSAKSLEILTQELITIKEITELILNQALVQIDLESIRIALLLNKEIAAALLEKIRSNILTISSVEIDKNLEKIMSENLNKKSSISFLQKLSKKNEKIIDRLVKAADRVGLTWYNKAYRFSRKLNMYEPAKFCALSVGTAITAIILYKALLESNKNNAEAHSKSKILGSKWLKKVVASSNEKFNKIVGEAPELKRNEGGNVIVDKFNNPETTNGSGLLKFWDIMKRNQLVTVTPIIAINPATIAGSIYGGYWTTIKKWYTKKSNSLHEILAGIEKKYEGDDYEDVFFDDMTGVENLEELANKITNFVEHPERYERAQIEEHRGILLYGPPQTGKTLFAKALRTQISKKLSNGKKIHFVDVKLIRDINPNITVEQIFYDAQSLSPCILFIDEIDLIGAHRSKNATITGQLLTCMQGLNKNEKQIIVIGATNKPEELDSALTVDGRFGKIVHVNYPDFNNRKGFLTKELIKRSIILEPDFIEYMAKETEGASYNKLKRIIMEALSSSAMDVRPVTQQDFENTIDIEIRKIETSYSPRSEEENKIIAAFQAGKSLIHSLLLPNETISKVTIAPVAKSIKMNEFGFAIKTSSGPTSENEKSVEISQTDKKVKDGETFAVKSSKNKSLRSDEEKHNDCLALLAGNIAQKVLLKKSFSNCNPQDRAEAMKLIYENISQGEHVDKNMKKEALSLKAKYEKEIEDILRKNIKILEKIMNYLLKKGSINGNEWQKIINI